MRFDEHRGQRWQAGDRDMAWRMRLGQRGWLRPTVLKVLEEGPMNGIEVMDRIRDMSHGWWRPSPGSIYPLLETLLNEGLASKREDGKYALTSRYKKAYAPITDSDEVLTSMEGDVSYLEELSRGDRKAISGYRDRLAKIAARLSKLK